MRTLEDARCIVSVAYRQTHTWPTHVRVIIIQGRPEMRGRPAQANVAPLKTDILSIFFLV